MGHTDEKITTRLLQDHIDTSKYGLSVTTLQRIRAEMGLKGVRSQKHTVESITPAMVEMRKDYPMAGFREAKKILFDEKGISVSREVISEYCHMYEPDLVKDRVHRRLRRRRFWAAGINDICAVDQHDKWQQFGLFLHVGMDPFCGRIHWLRIWYTNKNPRLIASYYLDFIEEFQAMPLVTQSDPGSENYGIANAHTTIRHLLDPSLVGTLQHRWMREKKNVMPEIIWSQLRSRWSPGFEDILQKGFTYDWYERHNPLDEMLFRWLFIPWLQRELDVWVHRINYNRKRHDPRKVRPQGPPQDIYTSPHQYGAMDFKVLVDQAAISHARQLFAPPDDVVFSLVPPEFDNCARALFAEIGSPVVGRRNIWDIYCDLHARFEGLEDANPPAYWERLLLSIESEDRNYALIDYTYDIDDRRGSGGELEEEGHGQEGDDGGESHLTRHGNDADSEFDPEKFFSDDDFEVVFSDDEGNPELEAEW